MPTKAKAKAKAAPKADKAVKKAEAVKFDKIDLELTPPSALGVRVINGRLLHNVAGANPVQQKVSLIDPAKPVKVTISQ